MAANQTDGSVLAIADDKLYITSNNGIDWLPLENGIHGLRVLSLAVDIDNTIYVGTSNGLYTSTDTGTSFQSANDQLPNDFGLFPAVGAVCALNDQLFIGTSAGVYKADKSSKQWQLFNNGLPLLDVNAILVFLNDNVFLGMKTGMYRSSVREANWEKVYDHEINDIIVVGSNLYAAGFAEPCNPAIRSSDFGNTWDPLGPGIGACEGLAIMGQGNGLWVGTSAHGTVMFSLDNGVSWQETRIEKANKIQALIRRGTSLLSATDFFPTNSNLYDGGVFIRSNALENIREIFALPRILNYPWRIC